MAKKRSRDIPVTAGGGDVFALRPYDPKKVSRAVAKEIAELVAKDDRGGLEFEELGKIKVRPPA